MGRRKAKKRKPLGLTKTDVYKEALRPFADVVLPDEPSGEDIWLYIGKYEMGHGAPHLKLSDLKRARQLIKGE